MKLSARARYATRILLELASYRGEGPLTASLLSRRTGISTQFIEQILKPLKRSGLTSSIRGALGGHILVRPPSDISLADVVRIMEGDITLSMCTASGTSPCERRDTCLTKNAWKAVSRRLEEAMSEISLEDLLAGNLPNKEEHP